MTFSAVQQDHFVHSDAFVIVRRFRHFIEQRFGFDDLRVAAFSISMLLHQMLLAGLVVVGMSL